MPMRSGIKEEGMRERPFFVDWAITGRCNLSCLHCERKMGGELSTEEAKRVVGEIAALKPGWVIVEGGEPLLRPDIFEILAHMRSQDLEVYLITNGMSLDGEKVGILRDLGVKVMVSIDSADPENFARIRRGARLEKVVGAARSLAAEGILCAVNTVISKENYREIPEILALSASLGARKVNLLGLKPCPSYAERVLSPSEYEEAIILACEGASREELELFFDEPFFRAAVRELGISLPPPETIGGILAPQTSACIFGQYIFIEPNGKVKPCSFAPQLVLGDVREKSLVEIWGDFLTSPFLSSIRDPLTRKGRCRECPYLFECKGCRSRTFALTGDWFASDPACPVKGGKR